MKIRYGKCCGYYNIKLIDTQLNDIVYNLCEYVMVTTISYVNVVNTKTFDTDTESNDIKQNSM
jgi:hypothetical protein